MVGWDSARIALLAASVWRIEGFCGRGRGKGRPMRVETRTLLTAAALAVAGVATASAADIAALTGHVTKLVAHCSALVYYPAMPDGFHAVVTTQQGLTDQAAIARFETVLAVGQSAGFSIPRRVGEAPAGMVLSNAGDHLHINEPRLVQ